MKSTGLLAGLGSYFSSSSLMLLSWTTSSPSRSTSYHGARREFSFLLQPPLLSSSEERLGGFLEALLSLLPHLLPPCAALFSQVPLGRIMQALEIIFALPTPLGATDCVSGFPPFGHFPTVVWLGLATCWRRTSERIPEVGSLHAHVFCFTSVSPSPGLSSCLALSNQQACVRPWLFSLDDQGH